MDVSVKTRRPNWFPEHTRKIGPQAESNPANARRPQKAAAEEGYEMPLLLSDRESQTLRCANNLQASATCWWHQTVDGLPATHPVEDPES